MTPSQWLSAGGEEEWLGIGSGWGLGLDVGETHSCHVQFHQQFFDFRYGRWVQCWFVCLFLLRFYGQVNPLGSCQVRSVYLTKLLLGRLSSGLTSIVHLLLPETDNCPS